MNFISGSQFLLLEKFQTPIGTAAGVQERKWCSEWWEHSTHTHAPAGQGLRGRHLSDISSCSSSSPAAITFYLQHAAPLMPERTGTRQRKARGGRAGCPGLPAVPSLGTRPCANLQEAADKNHLGEEITSLPAMWQARPVQRKEPSKFLPWPYCLAVQCPKGCGKRDLREIRPHFWP